MASLPKLKEIRISEIGLSSEWKKQYCSLQKLSLNLHSGLASFSALNQSESLMDQFINDHKLMEGLIGSLLRTEIWMTYVQPHIHHLSEVSILCNAVSFQESLILSLIQLCQDLSNVSEEFMSELCDYTFRKLSELRKAIHIDDSDNTIMIEEKKKKRTSQSIDSRILKLGALAASVLRHLTDICEESKLGSTGALLALSERLLSVNDTLTVLIDLLCENPFVNRNEKTMFEVSTGEWRQTDNVDILHNSVAQMWLAVYNILCRSDLNRKWMTDDRHVRCALRLRTLLTEELMAEIPLLSDLRRYLEEVNVVCMDSSAFQRYQQSQQQENNGLLSFVDDDPSSLSSSDDSCLVSTVVELRSQMVQELDPIHSSLISKWKSFNNTYSDRDRSRDCQMLFGIYMDDLDLVESLLEHQHKRESEVQLKDETAHYCAKCHKPADKRCARCKLVWYCSKACQSRSWKKHKRVCKQSCKVTKKQQREREATHNTEQECHSTQRRKHKSAALMF